MPAYQLKIRCEINVSGDVELHSEDISKVRSIVSAVKSQKFSPEALQALATASGIQIEAKMVGRSARVIAPADPA